MKNKVVACLLVAATVTGAIYAGNFRVEYPVETDCYYTGNLNQSCSYRHNVVNYRMLNCISNGNDCAFNLPPAPVE